MVAVFFLITVSFFSLVDRKVLNFTRVFVFIFKTAGVFVLLINRTECHVLDRLFFTPDMMNQVEEIRDKRREIIFVRLEGYDYWLASIWAVRIMLQLIWPYVRDFPYDL